MFAGIDTHKDTLAVGVVEPTGRVVAVTEVANNEKGFARLEALLVRQQVTKVGIEGSGGFGRAVAVRLALDGAAEVVEVPAVMTARERSSKPSQGKTDPVDAVAIARIVARGTVLPPVRLTTGRAADLRALIDYWDQLKHERSRLVSRVHAELGGLRPGYQRRLPRLLTAAQLRSARGLLRGDHGVRAELVRARLRRMGAIDAELKALHTRIDSAVVATGTTLTGIPGVSTLVAARLLGEIVDIDRYPSRDAFAAANGSAPIAASSGRTVRHRLSRGGNRKLNRCLYVMAITQIAHDSEGRAYYQRKRAQGKTGREAIRSLKRRLSDVVYRTMRQDKNRLPAPTAPVA